ncbi:MAG: hypothetical protein ACOC96_04625 [Actinomycetota bacterium]
MPQALGHRGGDEAFGDYEVIDLGRVSTDDEHPLSNLGLLEIDPPARTGDGDAARPNPGPPGWRARVALALAFVLGLTSGIVASRAPGNAADVPVALAAGPVSVDGEVVPLSPSAGVAPVSIRMHNSGRRDVEVLSVRLVAWRHSGEGSARSAVTVPTGQTRTVGTGVPLDCDQPRPPTASVLVVRLRTGDLGVISMTTSLSEPARELSRAWREFCA